MTTADKNPPGPKKFFFIFEILVLTLFLCGSTLLNNFPFIYYDSAYYLYFAKWFTASPVFVYRPLAYSGLLFILNSSSNVIILQGLLLSLCLVSLSRKLALTNLQRILVYVMLMLATPMLFVSNTLMPDIFTGLQILSAFLLIHKSTRRTEAFFWGVLFVLCSLFHYSNLIVAISFGILFCLKSFRRTFRFQFDRKRKAFFGLGLVVLMGTLPLIHTKFWSRSGLTDSAELMLFSRFTAFNISLEYLEKACALPGAEKPYKLCNVPEEGFNLWSNDPQSNINRAGGLNALREEIATINHQILLTPKLLFKFVRESFANVTKQTFAFHYEFTPILEDSTTLSNLLGWKESEAEKFQSQGLLRFEKSRFEAFKLKLEIYLSLWTGIAILFLVFWGLRHLAQTEKSHYVQEHRRLFKLFVLFHLLMSIVCGTLTEPNSRYSNRYLFVASFLLLLIVCQAYSQRARKDR